MPSTLGQQLIDVMTNRIHSAITHYWRTSELSRVELKEGVFMELTTLQTLIGFMKIQGHPTKVSNFVVHAGRWSRGSMSLEELAELEYFDIPPVPEEMKGLVEWWLIPEPCTIAAELANRLAGYSRQESTSKPEDIVIADVRGILGKLGEVQEKSLEIEECTRQLYLGHLEPRIHR